jgi:DNA primase
VTQSARVGRRSQRLTQSEFERLISDALDRHNLSDIVRRHTKLKRRGARELVGLCPFHPERSPSFEVNDGKGTYHCWGCGAAGNALQFLQQKEGLSFRDAFEALSGDRFPVISEEDRAKRKAEDAEARASAIAEARALWNTTVPVMGTPAERYLRSRSIAAPLPPSIRFGRIPLSRDPETGSWREAMPALVGAITMAGELVAIQRIFLRDDGADKRWLKPRKSKFSLGRLLGGAMRLDHGIEGSEIIITEGPEDALTLMQEMPGRRVWAALGTDLMPSVEFPPEVDSIVIAGQNDQAGRAAVVRAGEALLSRGYAVRDTYPHPDFKDWNDQLRGIRQ